MKFWDITIYDDGEARETVHGLTHAQKITLMEIFEGEGIPVMAVEYDRNREPTGESETIHM